MSGVSLEARISAATGATGPAAQLRASGSGVSAGSARADIRPEAASPHLSRTQYLLGYQTPLTDLALLQAPEKLLSLVDQVLGSAAADTLKRLLQAPLTPAALQQAVMLNGPGQGGELLTLWQLISQLRAAILGRPGHGWRYLREDLGRVLDYLDGARLETLLRAEQQEVFLRLPLVQAERPPTELIVQGRPSQTGTDEPEWSVDLHLCLPTAAELWIRCRLQPARSLAAEIWCDDAELARQLLRGVGQLQEALAAVGMPLDQCRVHVGRPPVARAAAAPKGSAVDLST